MQQRTFANQKAMTEFIAKTKANKTDADNRSRPSVVSATSCARRRLIRDVSPKNAAMTFHAIYFNPFQSIRHIAAAVVFLTCLTSPVRAASDTDVTIIKAEKVVIEDSVITIIGEARANALLTSDRATFIIKRPELNFNDPDGSHADEKERTKKVLDDAWVMSLAAAKELQAGRKIGRIGFYAPDIASKGTLIDSIVGFGYLYPKRD